MMMAKARHAVEVKVQWATYMAVLAGAGVALLNAFVADSDLLGTLPPWLQFVISLVVPPLITFLGGYYKPSTTSVVSEGYAGKRAA